MLMLTRTVLKQIKVKQRCAMGVGMFLYHAQLVQTKKYMVQKCNYNTMLLVKFDLSSLCRWSAIRDFLTFHNSSPSPTYLLTYLLYIVSALARAVLSVFGTGLASTS